MKSSSIESLITYVAKSLVQFPDKVQVRSYPKDEETIIELKVAAEDMSLIIGRKGTVIKSLHSFLVYYSGRYDQSYRLDLVN